MIAMKEMECSDNHRLIKWLYKGNKNMIPQCPLCHKQYPLPEVPKLNVCAIVEQQSVEEPKDK